MTVGFITPFFDFQGNPKRYLAYLLHRRAIQHSTVAHVTVEFQLPDRPFVLDGLPDVMHLRCDAPKWYKTNALNIGAKNLINRGCTVIAWSDADCVLPLTDWPQLAADALRQHDVIQLQRRCQMPDEPDDCVPSFIAGNMSGHDGGGWATRSEFFERVGYFECVVSGANKAILTPISRDIWARARPAYAKRLDRYAERASRYVRSAGHLDLTVCELNHGSRDARRSFVGTRFDMLAAYDFDFDRDCQYDRNGILRWSNPESPVARAVASYMGKREEA